MFYGSIVALISPMALDGNIDIAAFKSLIERHIQAGTNALVINGSTGESVSLSMAEQGHMLRIAIEQARQRIPIIAGTGSASTRETIENCIQAEKLGANACLVVTPYYSRPTQEGLYLHYQAVAASVSLPIILYNVPTRTGIDLLPETVARLQSIPNIIGLKEATGDGRRMKELLQICHQDFVLLSGDDASALSFILQGAKGVISVTANVAPALMSQMCTAALKRDIKTAGELNTRLMPLHKLLFTESNPIPVKWALHERRLSSRFKGSTRAQ